MPYAEAAGAKLYFEECGTGFPVVFVHEFAGNLKSWEPQLRYFARMYRCIAYNARGYPPSEVPGDVSAYSQAIATDDIAAVMRGAGIDKAHIVGLSMGGFATLHFGLRYPEMAKSLTVAGCGYGAEHEKRDQFAAEANKLADGLDAEGMEAMAKIYGAGPTRVQLENKDPRGYAEFMEILANNSAKGAALTMRGVQAHRPSIYDLEPQLKKLTVPTLLILGDEDEPCLDVNLYMKRVIPSAGLVYIPQTGHACNIEEPDAFNAALREFFLKAEQDRWGLRDPRSVADSILTTR